MGGVSPETRWASYKYGIIKFWYIVASCWIFLYELYCDACIHEHQTKKHQIFSSSLSVTAQVSNPYKKQMKQNNSTFSCPQMTVFLTAYCFHTLHTNKFIHSKNVLWNTLFWVKRTLLFAFHSIIISNPVHCFIKSQI